MVAVLESDPSMMACTVTGRPARTCSLKRTGMITAALLASVSRSRSTSRSFAAQRIR